MKVYTKTGDQGETQVYAKQMLRLKKDDPILESYGTLDELNAHTGLLTSLLSQDETTDLHEQLTEIQQLLFQIGFAISAETKLNDDHVANLENAIDTMTETLPPQTHFILPGGSQAASQAHVCRTVTRRAERQLIRLSQQHEVPAVCIRYVNRLSDYFFVTARWLNHQQGIVEPIVP
ncbi:cob(I)yrinic acid a,c-diamide adenosyltransferase [Alteromonadaceae bacterium M269]|nr:cob(I)yrinic acid a,c-diamide adenosyltransferase [Alteromonadaceae bacterium M269]